MLMKRFLQAIFLWQMIMAIFPYRALAADGVEWGTVVYSENLNGVSTVRNRNRQVKQNRKDFRLLDSTLVVSRQGKFIAICEESYFMTMGVLHSLKLAMDIWEERLNISVPINFYVVLSEEMDDDTAISTTVLYSMKSRGVSIPRNLYRQTYSLGSIENKDTIRINAFADWGVSWVNNDMYAGTYSLTTYFLRHIAHILGFGSSVVDRNGNKGFAVLHALSPFDRLLDKNGQGLKATFSSSAIENYFKGSVNVKTPDANYALFADGDFHLDTSGKYFSLGHDNIMEHPLVDASQSLTVNAETLDVMGAMGWSVSPHDVEIVCDSTNAQGYGSMYRGYTFRLVDSTSGSAQNQCTWQYQIYANGEYVTLNTFTGSNFTISPDVRTESLDEFNCQQARVLCTYKGREYTYLLFLEPRPLIESVICSNRHSLGNGFYGFDISIRTRGANSGTVNVYDGAGSSFDYPITGEVLHVGPFVDGMQAYVSISLENSFGYATNYIELGEIEEPKEASAKGNTPSIAVRCNGEPGKTVFQDGDSVTMDLEYGNTALQIDSMKWEVELTDIFDRKKRYTISKETSASFVVSPDRKCCFAKSSYSQFHFMGGNYWIGVPSFVPDSCRFICTAYISRGEWDSGDNWISVKSRNYSFDVLPKCPVLEELETWTEPGDEEWPFTRIRIDTDNYESIQLFVQPWDYIAFQERMLFKGDSLEFVMEPRGWNNEIYCYVDNKYGVYKSDRLKIPRPAGMDKHEGQPSCHIRQNGKEVTITSEVSCKVAIYDMSGRVVFCAEGTTATTSLPSGIYVAKVEDKHGKRLLTNKICIK